jgi:hypothetical protein
VKIIIRYESYLAKPSMRIGSRFTVKVRDPAGLATASWRPLGGNATISPHGVGSAQRRIMPESLDHASVGFR